MATLSTDESFNSMLKRYMPYKLLSDEIIKRDYFLQRVSKDTNWKGGALQVPFVGANATSLSIGSLSDTGDIGSDTFVRGEVANYAEMWGAMVFNQKDLDQHNGSAEGSFLKILPDRIDVFAQTMKEAISGQLLNGSAIDKIRVVNNGTIDNIEVERPERFEINQKIVIAAAAGGQPLTYYVSKVTVQSDGTGLLELSDTSSQSGTGLVGATDLNTDLTAADLIYHPGVVAAGNTIIDEVFSSLPSQLLASGQVSGVATGSADLFGQTKASYKHLQALNVDGSSLDFDSTSAANSHLEKIFDAQTTVRRLGRGNPGECLMSYRNFAQCMKELEGKREYQADVSKASKYGWSEIQVVGVKGALKLVAVPELDDSNIMVVDFDSMKLHSNGFVERRTAPDGKQFFETRGTTGYSYIVDHRFYGDLVCSKPSANAIIHDVPVIS